MRKKHKTKCEVVSNTHTCLETQEVQKSMKKIKTPSTPPAMRFSSAGTPVYPSSGVVCTFV